MDNGVKVGQIRRDPRDSQVIKILAIVGNEIEGMVVAKGSAAPHVGYEFTTNIQYVERTYKVDETYRVKETLKRYGYE